MQSLDNWLALQENNKKSNGMSELQIKSSHRKDIADVRVVFRPFYPSTQKDRRSLVELLSLHNLCQFLSPVFLFATPLASKFIIAAVW